MDIILINNLFYFDLYMNDKHVAFKSNDVRNMEIKKKINTNFLILVVSVAIMIFLLLDTIFYRIIPFVLIVTFFSLYTKLLPMWIYSIKITIGSQLYNLFTNKKEVYLEFLDIIKKV